MDAQALASRVQPGSEGDNASPARVTVRLGGAMEFRILGPLEARDEGRPLKLGGAKQRALLAILLLYANEVVSRERLIEGLWGSEPPETAAKALQVYVSRLRKALAPHALLHTKAPGNAHQLEPGQLDLDRFGPQALEAIE